MAPTVDFLKFKCQNTDDERCAMCQRDFILPVSAIEGAYKTSDEKVELMFNQTHFAFDPRCLGSEGSRKLRLLKVSISWTQFISDLDGRIVDCGDTLLIQLNP
jgi:hypothetical protein